MNDVFGFIRIDYAGSVYIFSKSEYTVRQQRNSEGRPINTVISATDSNGNTLALKYSPINLNIQWHSFPIEDISNFQGYLNTYQFSGKGWSQRVGN
jgi:hypothetical protein